MSVCAFMYVCVNACMRSCERICEYVFVRACVRAIFANNALLLLFEHNTTLNNSVRLVNQSQK